MPLISPTAVLSSVVSSAINEGALLEFLPKSSRVVVIYRVTDEVRKFICRGMNKPEEDIAAAVVECFCTDGDIFTVIDSHPILSTLVHENRKSESK